MHWLREAIDYGIIGLLVVLSIVALAIAIERYWVFRKVKFGDYTESKSLEIALTNKLHIIATIGSNAPYIGLLGTVMGIMLTFYTMGTEGFMDTGKIMVGLSLALKATAVGLLAAIPAITMYNFLVRRVKVLMAQWEMENGKQRV